MALLAVFDHPKLDDLQFRLDVNRAWCIGILECLWRFTAMYAPEGDIGKHPNHTIARRCHWEGDPDSFVNALVASGWIDECDETRLKVHDWGDHAPNWLKGSLAKQGITLGGSSDGVSEASQEGRARYSKVKKGKVKNKTKREVPSFVAATHFGDFVEHRREIGKPLTDRAYQMAVRQLEGWHREGYDCDHILMTCVASGWRGLHLPSNCPKRKADDSGAPPC